MSNTNDVIVSAGAANKIRVGIVDAGTWAEYGPIPALKLLPQFEITALYCRSAERAAELAERYQIR